MSFCGNQRGKKERRRSLSPQFSLSRTQVKDQLAENQMWVKNQEKRSTKNEIGAVD